MAETTDTAELWTTVGEWADEARHLRAKVAALEAERDRLGAALEDVAAMAQDRLDVLKEIGTRRSDWTAMADIRDHARAARAGGEAG